MFELSYESIGSNEFGSWKAALVPWDSETFGFNVAVLQAANPDAGVEADALRGKIQSYASSRNISMIITSIPGEHQPLSQLLQSMGFIHVDIALSIQYSMLKFQSRAHRITFRDADQQDVVKITDIAQRAFMHGRYHQDCKIPLNLANKRYGDWIMRTQIQGNSQRLLAAEIQGCSCGFSIVEQKGMEGYLHLIALSPEWRGKGLGVELLDSSLSYLKTRGVELVKSKVSASNLSALNMYSALGAEFMDCEHLLHWHIL